jgi:hypothetical protein
MNIDGNPKSLKIGHYHNEFAILQLLTDIYYSDNHPRCDVTIIIIISRLPSHIGASVRSLALPSF